MVKRFAFGWGLASIVALGWASAGSAEAETAQEILSTFNLVTTGDVSTTQDIVGNAVVGGSLSGASFFAGGSNVPASPELDLYGTLENAINLNAGGDLYYNGAINPPNVGFNGGGSQKPLDTTTNPLSDYTAPLEALSTQLENLTPTLGTSIVNGTFKANGATGIVVFDITALQLETDLANNQVTFSGTGVTSFIINVEGNFTEPSSTNFNTAQEDALFNFYDATSVTLGNWKTSILAPKADLSISNGFVTGSVFAASFSGGGELHNDNLFNGALPSSAPETSTWAMMLAGFAGLGFVGFRRSRKEPVAAF
jgi:choice-of-anchor A domain-containing protein